LLGYTVREHACPVASKSEALRMAPKRRVRWLRRYRFRRIALTHAIDKVGMTWSSISLCFFVSIQQEPILSKYPVISSPH